MKPPFTYFGGKIRIAEQIASLLPEHDHYVEPYAGSLAVLLAKSPVKLETVNDLDGDLMTLWRVLRDRPTDLARVCALTPHARAELAAAWEPAADDLEAARRVWVVLTQGRGATLRDAKTGWKHFVYPGGTNFDMPDYLEAYVGRMASVAERLAKVSLECMPALDLIGKYGAHSDVLLYVDPPYLGSTRGWGLQYRHEMKAAEDHRALADALHKAKAAVVVSGYPSDLYDLELYPGWDRHTLSALTGNATGDKSRTEVLWSNRPLGAQLRLFGGGA